MKLPPSLSSLKFFMLAAQHESFKLASEKLFVTQAAVSQQIRLLEASLNTKLFDRHGGKTKLTREGKLLLPFIEQAFNQVELGLSAIEQQSRTHELKISALHSITSLVLIPKMESFIQAYPDMQIHFSPNNKLDNLHDLDIDVAIRRGKGTYIGLESRKLTDDKIVLVASPTFNQLNLHDINDVVNIPLLQDTSSDIEEALDDFVNQFHIQREDLSVTLRTTDALPIVQHALAGKGMALVSKALVNDFIKEGTLINVLNYQFNSDRTLYLVAPKAQFALKKTQNLEAWLKTILN